MCPHSQRKSLSVLLFFFVFPKLAAEFLLLLRDFCEENKMTWKLLKGALHFKDTHTHTFPYGITRHRHHSGKATEWRQECVNADQGSKRRPPACVCTYSGTCVTAGHEYFVVVVVISTVSLSVCYYEVSLLHRITTCNVCVPMPECVYL